MFNHVFGSSPLIPKTRVSYAVSSAFDGNPFGWAQHRTYNKGNVFEEIVKNPVTLVTEPFKALDREVLQPLYREVIKPVGNALEKVGQGIANDPNTKDVSVKELSQPALLSALSSAATWERYDSRSEDWATIDPPQKIVSVVYDATDYRHLAPLNGLSHQPYLRPDGTFAKDAGYDRQSGMFGIFDAKRFHIPDNPTREDAKKALGGIEYLLSEFSFAKDTDRAAALSAILTASIRASLPLAPMFHAKAPQIGSGKSFLCQLITAFASPKYGAPTSFPHDDEECRKLLLAELLRAPAVLEFDNLTSDIIPHKSLCTALTSEYLTGRILGLSKTTTVGTRTLFLSSGNNVSPVADMARRCLTITLDTKCETPANKVYKNTNLIQDVLKEREKFVFLAIVT